MLRGMQFSLPPFALLSLVALSFSPTSEPQDREVPPFWTLVERLAQHDEVREEFDIVLDHMAGISARRSRWAIACRA